MPQTLSTGPNGSSPEELQVKEEELRVRRIEAEKALAAARSPWWRRPDPLLLAILAAVLSLFANMVVALVNNGNSLTQQKNKAADDLALEQAKASYTLVLQAMATNDSDIAKRNIHFFIDAGLLADPACKIRNAIDQNNPVLPSVSGATPQLSVGHSALEIARLYNFPPGLDGRGQTIGLLELGGGFDPKDLAAYFAGLNLPDPEVTAVSVDGGRNDPAGSATDTQVAMDIEIAGAIAPKARIRVYFAPPETGFVDAVKQATADRVSVLSIGWGGPETAWKDADISKMDNALAEAANQHMTVVVSTGGQGVTDGVSDKHRHVDFPSSSPWVLSVGGTSIRVEAGRIKAEAVWKNQDGGFASGGGASEKFSRPDWQSAVAIPAREAGGLGRGIPDVVAFVDATLGYGIRVHGKTEVVGGTGAAAPLWAGLVALINQGLGHNIGYFNPRLYREIGPTGVLSAITEGDNSVGGVEGFKAGPGWTPVAGWGRPDGMKLLNWLRMHPDAQRPDASVNTACATQSQ